MTFAFYIFIFVISIEYAGLYKLFPILKTLHFSTLASIFLFLFVLLKSNYRDLIAFKQVKLIIIFIFFSALTILYATISHRAYLEFRSHVSYFFLLTIGFFLLRDYRRFTFFIFFFFLLHCYIVLQNFGKLAGGHRVGSFKAGFFYGDGNDLAWGLAIALPLFIPLFFRSKSIVTKLALSFSAVIILFGIMGTGSRGAAIALAVSFLVFLAKYKKIFLPAIIISLVLSFFMVLGPSEYFERIESIKEYSEDSSAMMRFRAWNAAIQMAFDHPMGVGAGNFSSAYGREYMQRLGDFSGWAARRWISPHSIYFSVLGEYGFIGLLLFMSILYYNYITLAKLIKHSIDNSFMKDRFHFILISLSMSLIAYAIGGIFLGGVNYPHLYLLTFLITRCHKLIEEKIDTLPY